jgi:hypothetical protein
VVWGCNYDRDDSHRLIEDFWHEDWPRLAADFREMKALDANVVRIHLQLAAFMNAPDAPKKIALARLTKLLARVSHWNPDFDEFWAYFAIASRSRARDLAA